jgi:iron(III) transport system substrate-binding protein
MSRSNLVGRRIAFFCTALLTTSVIGLSSLKAQQAQPDPRSGTVRIYVSLATEAVGKLVQAYNKKFPNLKIEFIRAGSAETIKRFTAERQAGRIGTDLIHGADPGGFEYFGSKGWLDKRLVNVPAVQAMPKEFYDKDAGWVALRATGIALMYNTKLVRKEDVPKTWKDLENPKWKGRIAISDPTRAGSSFSHLFGVWKLYGPDHLKKLAANDIFIAGDGTATRNAIAQGERDLAPVSEYDAFRIKAEGAPVEIAWLEDGTFMVPAPLALVKDSPNSANALALAEFMLSKEGQEIITDVIKTWSPRNDVVAPEGKPKLSSIKVANIDWEKAATEKNQLMDLYFQYFQKQ